MSSNLDLNDKVLISRVDDNGVGTSTAVTLGELIPTGWENHVDQTYTAGSPFNPATGQWTAFTSGNWSSLVSQRPLDVDMLFDPDTDKITGRTGDGIGITVELTAKPTTATVTYLDFAIDIGGAVGRIYPHTLSFPKGQNQTRTQTISVNAYTLDTWEANGGALVFNPNAAIDIYGVRVIVKRHHKAR